VVHQEMLATKSVEDLTRLTALLDKKVSQEGIEGATKWSAQLTAWADKLQPPKKDDGGGGGGGGQGKEPDPAVMAAIMKLMRIRLSEDDLRSNTRALNFRQKEESYPKQAEGLSDRQSQLRDDTLEAGQVLKNIPEVAPVLAAVDQAMKDATFILARPQTDNEAIAAQTEVIELLTDMMEKSSKNSSASGNAAGMMAMLQAMLQQQQGNGKQPGKSPGGSNAGGTTDRENVPVTGDATGNANDHRNVDKSAGRDLNKVPAEFREAMQAYFEKVDKW
jgi:hypothetical protein